MNVIYKLPDGWKWVRLGDVCEINPRRPKNFVRAPNTPTTFVPMSAVDERTGSITKPEVVPYSKVSKGYTYFEENDVLFAKITPCMQNGKHVIARNLIDGIGFGTTEFHVLRPKSEIISEWIWYFIRQKHFLNEAIAHFTGAVGQQRVPDSFLSNYIIPLPHLETQRRIVKKLNEIMSEIEKTRTACEKQLGAAKALPAAYLRKVFESEEAKKWEKRRLAEVFAFTQSGIWGDEPEDLYNEDVFPVLRSTEIDHRGRIVIEKEKLAFRKVQMDKAKKYFVEPGDLLIVRSGGTTGKIILGRIGLYEGERNKFLFSNFLLRAKVNLKIAIPEYLWYYLNWEEFLEENIPRLMRRTTGIQNLPMNEYFAIEIPLPPLLTQHRIANYLKEKMAEVEKLCTAIEKQLEAINALPQAYLRKAFRGEL